ncbi:hypothetical protein ACFE04_003694 [Oxalis oulophora]
MEGIPNPIPKTVEEVFTDYKGRRAALIKALTTDAEKFYRDCDPEKENLCLYGLPNGSWEVNLPVEEVPPEKRLFQMINDFPTIYEVVTKTAKQPKDQPATLNSGVKNRPTGKPRQVEAPSKPMKVSPPPKEDDDSDEEEDEDEEQGATCGACGTGDTNGVDEFWICCDLCERWFHGKCVKITPAKAEHIKHYKCPGCSNKRARV